MLCKVVYGPYAILNLFHWTWSFHIMYVLARACFFLRYIISVSHCLTTKLVLWICLRSLFRSSFFVSIPFGPFYFFKSLSAKNMSFLKLKNQNWMVDDVETSFLNFLKPCKMNKAFCNCKYDCRYQLGADEYTCYLSQKESELKNRVANVWHLVTRNNEIYSMLMHF